MRITPQRRMIVDLIHDNVTHLTAEDIIKHVQEHMPGVNKSTVYRTLDILEKTGCVYKSEMGDHVIYHHAEEGHHHHLVCEKCGRTMECAEDIVVPFQKSLREKYGFEVHLQHLVMNGLCDKCRGNQGIREGNTK
jgi:Fur family transcriptional regulator, ferric uptake regulator